MADYMNAGVFADVCRAIAEYDNVRRLVLEDHGLIAESSNDELLLWSEHAPGDFGVHGLSRSDVLAIVGFLLAHLTEVTSGDY